MIKVELQRVDDAFAFEAKDAANHIIKFDAAKEIGGNNSGVRPMQTLLMSLGSCSGIDIVSILKKQKQTINSFNIIIEGEREQGKEPALWKYVKVVFKFDGNVDAEKARKACALSIDKYCSVAATLRAAGCTIEWEVEVNN
ncbi:MAG: OsmC family protein [Bacteroidetes bacterium]|nr:OsmC family protein [Bacteroidota bacterium]MBS1591282.1 OsmC family protein [Bacteroidota bacterium]